MGKTKYVWSKRRHAMAWGFDAVIRGRRYRRIGLPTREAAEEAMEDLYLAGNVVDARVPADSSLREVVKIGSIGAMAELLVAADLLQQGFDVFRSVSANACCDLIAQTQDGRLCRIEVKSAVVNKRGYTDFSHQRHDPSKYDILALVFLRQQQIEYSRDLSEWFSEKNGTKRAVS